MNRNNRNEDISPVDGVSWFGSTRQQVNGSGSLEWPPANNNDPDVWPPPSPVEHRPGPQVRPQKMSRRNESSRVPNRNQKVVPNNSRNSASRSQIAKKNEDVKKGGPKKDTNGHNTNGTVSMSNILIQGCYAPGKPENVREFYFGQGISGKIGNFAYIYLKIIILCF